MIGFLMRLINPPMCGEKIKPVASFKQPDYWDADQEMIVAGSTFTTWQTCGLRPGHAGAHGGYQRFGRVRVRLANWLDR